MATLIGNEVPSPQVKRTQVYNLTHEGADKLPLRDRAFISFSYGGRAIEDFNLIATFQSDRLQRAAYAQFEDITTTYEVVDGQFYWGTHFLNNTLDFSLSTDGISDNELSDFKSWFKPGQIRELVLAETPNRAIYARVATPPVYSVIPFEEQVKKKINGVEYSTTTACYRGEISLSFVMDEPFWHARNNIIGTYFKPQEDKFASTFEDEEGTVSDKKETLSDPDFIKAILEDGVAHKSMIDEDSGIIFGNETQGVDIDSSSLKYLYYCGTAPSKPLINFSIIPYVANDYIVFPYNYKTAEALNEVHNSYNILKIGDTSMYFTLPAAFIGFNQAIDTCNQFNVGESVEDLRAALRDNITEYFSRSWAMFCIETMKQRQWGVTAAGALTAEFTSYFKRAMRYFITSGNEGGLDFISDVSINCETGEVFIRLNIRTVDTSAGIPSTIEEFAYHPFFIVEESAEDMIRSKYLQIEQRCHPNDEGMITPQDCLAVSTDCPAIYGCLKNFIINYQNCYL